MKSTSGKIGSETACGFGAQCQILYRNDNDQTGGNICVNQIVAQASLQYKKNLQAGKIPSRIGVRAC